MLFHILKHTTEKLNLTACEFKTKASAMCSVNYMETVMNLLYKYLTTRTEMKGKIIHPHTRNLEKKGDMSFPLLFSCWSNHINTTEKIGHKHPVTIPEYFQQDDKQFTEKLIHVSKSWPLFLSQCCIVEDRIFASIERPSTFAKILQHVNFEKQQYGSCDLKLPNVCIEGEMSHQNITDVTDLRAALSKNVVLNLLKFCKVVVTTNSAECNHVFTITTKKKQKKNAIFCGPVINPCNSKKLTISSEEYHSNRTNRMRSIAEHKYGLRISKQIYWKEFLKKLGDAAVTIELLQNKTQRSVRISVDNAAISCNKDASFILYNCARVAKILKEFNSRVSLSKYPPLCKIEEADFTLLIQPEEWELLYVYILQFPVVIKNCIRYIQDCMVNIHYLITHLSDMCITYSAYYRRIRILTEAKDHLYPVLHARIYLLQAVEQVLHNGLRLLDIQPVTQM